VSPEETAVLAMVERRWELYVERLTARIALSARWQPDEIVRFTEGPVSRRERLIPCWMWWAPPARTSVSSTRTPGN